MQPRATVTLCLVPAAGIRPARVGRALGRRWFGEHVLVNPGVRPSDCGAVADALRRVEDRA